MFLKFFAPSPSYGTLNTIIDYLFPSKKNDGKFKQIYYNKARGHCSDHAFLLFKFIVGLYIACFNGWRFVTVTLFSAVCCDMRCFYVLWWSLNKTYYYYYPIKLTPCTMRKSTDYFLMLFHLQLFCLGVELRWLSTQIRNTHASAKYHE